MERRIRALAQALDYKPTERYKNAHHLTQEDSRKGAAASQAVRSMKKKFHYEKMLKKLGIEGATVAEILHTFQAAMQSPIVAGTVSYLGVAGLEMLTNSYYSTTQTMQQKQANKDVSSIINLIGSALPPGLSQAFSFGGTFANSAATSNNPLTVDFYALKGAILVYIATGGNLAGLLGSVSGFFKGTGAGSGSGIP